MFYHNLTAKYNGYFNAKELLDQSAEALDTRYVDNYTNVLELYKYNGIEDASDASANLDIAIKKASTVINLHRPSHWVGRQLLAHRAGTVLQKRITRRQRRLLKFMTQNYNKLHESPKTDSKAQAAKDRAVRVQEQIEKRETAQKDKEKLKKTQDKERKAKLKTRDHENKEKQKRENSSSKIVKKVSSDLRLLLLRLHQSLPSMVGIPARRSPKLRKRRRSQNQKMSQKNQGT
ncbi:MAG: hypothetical protein IPF93_14915 [Saprospiraceae bacterium]|nr:hypothetical protein [Saprospiraceae bacterium]